MNYSLFNRFQGCLWGLVLGEALGSGGVSSLSLPSGEFQQGFDLRHSSVAVALLAAMIDAQTWKPALVNNPEIRHLSTENLTDAVRAIATLPIALFYHDDLNRQRQALEQMAEALQQDSESWGWSILFAYSVSQALKGQLDPHLFVDQSQAYLRITTTNTTVPLEAMLQQLDAIKHCLRSLTQTAQLQHPVAIAITYFLHTPTNLPLALLRVQQRFPSHPGISALTGALSGAHNGAIAIPAAWQVALTHSSQVDRLPQAIPTLARQLLATWSGVYLPSQTTDTVPSVVAPWVVHFP